MKCSLIIWNSFNDVIPAAAILFLGVNQLNKQSIARIESVQQQSRNSFTIFIGDISVRDWCEFQMMISPGYMRFLRASTDDDAVDLIKNLHTIMTQKDKFEKQKLFFRKVEQSYTGTSAARRVMKETLQMMDVDEIESDEILTAFHSIAEVLAHAGPGLKQQSSSSMISNLTNEKFARLFGSDCKK